eukprot:GHVT01009634.1.p1 GENE.GHVT01009634.1~~GHVT01009634.1.p1  ORF type:complete len:523 (+),score=108.80 GHVT01009634.1:253-1821(+)
MPAAMQGGAASHSVASFPPSMQEWPVDGEAPCSAKAAALTAAAPPIEQLQLATRPVAFPTDVKFVRFENCDLRGLSTGVLILRGHAARFASLGRPLFAGLGAFAANGGIPRSLPFQTSCPNARLFPCAGTVRRLPHQPTVARVLCELCASDLRHDGGVGPTAKGLGPGPDRGDPKAPQPLQIDPRAACRRQLARLRALGLCLLSSFEMEFFLLEMRGDDLSTVRPAGIDSSFARTASLFELHPFIEKATDVLAALGVNLEAVGKEHPAGQLEFIPAPSFGVRAADDAFTIRNSVKEVARMEGKYATFMVSIPWITPRARTRQTFVPWHCHGEPPEPRPTAAGRVTGGNGSRPVVASRRLRRPAPLAAGMDCLECRASFLKSRVKVAASISLQIIGAPLGGWWHLVCAFFFFACWLAVERVSARAELGVSSEPVAVARRKAAGRSGRGRRSGGAKGRRPAPPGGPTRAVEWRKWRASLGRSVLLGRLNGRLPTAPARSAAGRSGALRLPLGRRRAPRARQRLS